MHETRQMRRQRLRKKNKKFFRRMPAETREQKRQFKHTLKDILDSYQRIEDITPIHTGKRNSLIYNHDTGDPMFLKNEKEKNAQ